MAKVIFSQASVIHSVQGGGGFSKFWGGVPPILGGGSSNSNFSGGVPPNFRGGFHQIFGGVLQIFGGSPILGGGSPPKYGQCSAGRHPTGMHSCLGVVFKCQESNI